MRFWIDIGFQYLVGGFFPPIWNIAQRQIGSWNTNFRGVENGENEKWIFFAAT